MSSAPRPLDVRWVPALLGCLLLGQWTPGLPAGAATLVSLGCAALAAAAGLGLLVGRHRGSTGPGRRRGVATALVLAGIAGALVVQHAALARAGQERAGWTDVVAAGQAVRVQVRPSGEAQASEGRFGPRWAVPVTVEAFGHPIRPLAPAAEATLGGPGPAPALPGTAAVCVVVTPRGADGVLRLDARSAPTPCGPDAATPEDPAPAGPSGRDRLQAAFRAAAADGVGTAPELVPGLVLGDRSAQSAETEQAMKDAGLSHLSAVSGANCALLLGVVTLALRSLRVHRAAVTAAGLGTLVVFVVVVGPEPSVLRAAVMGALGALAVFLGRGRAAFSLLSAGGVLLLVAIPDLAREVAFHLSLAATAGIVLAAAPADRLMHAGLSRVLPGVPARWLSASLAVTVAAHLACQPILLAMTGTLSTWAVPANLVAAPAVAPVTVLGTLAAALVLPAPAVAEALVWLIQWPAAFIGLVATTAASAPGAVRPWPGGPLGLGLGVLLTAATLAGVRLLLVLERTPRAPVRRVGASAPARRTRLRAGAVLTGVLGAAALGVCGAVLVPRPAGPVPDGWAAAFCDVGQGDMTVVPTAPGHALVVDTGPDPELARRCLQDLRITHVDALLLTHLHADHAGALAAFTGEMTPDAVRYGTRDRPAAATPGAPRGEEPGVAPPEGATRLATGEGAPVGAADWRVLLADGRAAEENDASAQVLVTVTTPAGPVTLLVTGDMEEAASAAWAAGTRSDAAPPPPVDVLKVAHHGARNGGLAVPEAVHARLQVISVGADNDYGHPHPSTVAGLQRLGPVARTDQGGTLVVVPAPDGSLSVHSVRGPTAPAP